MTTEKPPDLCITLLHGTWPRGFFRQLLGRIGALERLPGRPSSGGRKRNGKSLWFEEDSQFAASLTSKLKCQEVSYKITPFEWSGANSIFERDRAAKNLAARIQSSRAAYPQAMQVVVAHSHGGNIFRLALTHLANKQKLAVVTLATPFVQVVEAMNLDEAESFVRFILASYLRLTLHPSS